MYTAKQNDGSNKKDFAVVNSLAELQGLSGMRLGATIEQTAYHSDVPFGKVAKRKVESTSGGIDSVTMADGLSANLYAGEAWVDWFGAKGDDSTDDSAAIQLAFDSGAVMVKGTPDKTYILLNVECTTVGCTLDLNGSTWKTKSTAVVGDYLIQFTGAGITVKNGTIDGNKANVVSAGVTYAEATNVGGLQLSGDCTGFTLQDCTIQNHLRTQIVNNKTNGDISGIRIINNSFSVSDGRSIFLSGGTDGAAKIDGSADGIQISGNSFYDTYGIKLNRDSSTNAAYPQQIQITNNRLIKSASIAVRGIKAIISDNYIDLENDLGADPDAATRGYDLGITHDAASESVITGNIVRGFGSIGIEANANSANTADTDVLDGSPVILAHNEVVYTAGAGTTTTGLDVSSIHNGAQITGNHLRECVIRIYGRPENYENMFIDLSDQDIYNRSIVIADNNLIFKDATASLKPPIDIALGLITDLVVTGNVCNMANGSGYSVSDYRQVFIAIDAEAGVRNLLCEGNSLYGVKYICTYNGKQPVSIGDSTTQFDVTNPSGTTFRYTYDGTGTDPLITSSNLPTHCEVTIAGTDFSAGNEGTFAVTGSGANYFEVDNASGVVESDILINAGSILVDPVHANNTGNLIIRGNSVYGDNFGSIFRSGSFATTSANVGYAFAEQNKTPFSAGNAQSDKYIFTPSNWDAVVTVSGAVTEYPGFISVNPGGTVNSTAMARLPFDWTGNKGAVGVLTLGEGWSFTCGFDSSGITLNGASGESIARIIVGKQYNAAYGLGADACVGFEIRYNRTLYGFYHDGATTKYIYLNKVLNQRFHELEINNVGGVATPSLHFLIDGDVAGSLFDVESTSTNLGGTGISLESANRTTGVISAGRDLIVGNITLHDWSVSL